MPERTYSNLECGCYYTDENSAWILCAAHTTQERQRYRQRDYLSRLIQKEKKNTDEADHNKWHDSFMHNPSDSPQTFTSTPQRLVQRAIHPIGKYDISRIRTDRSLTMPTIKKHDLHSEIKEYWLYVLYLTKNKYYIGMTAKSNPLYRINSHGGISGALWTKMYKPIKIVEIIDIGKVTKEQAERMENDLTLIYMNKHGRDKVRGGYMATPGWLYFKVKNPTILRPLQLWDAIRFAWSVFLIYVVFVLITSSS